MIKIAFFDTKEYDKKLFDEYNKHYGYDITYLESKLNSETAPLAKGYDAVCIFVNDRVDEKTINILKECGVKLIALRCAGYNNVDIKKLGDGLTAVRVPAYSPYAVAEHTTALLLSIDRKIYKAYQRTRKYNFTLNGLLGFDIHGKTVGVIGSGKIGKAFISIMKGFGTRILAYDKFQDEKAAKEMGFEYVDLDTLYKESDIISLHCPLTDENYKMINEESLNKMKDGVIIINTARGSIIDTADLIEALESGKISACALDVIENELGLYYNDYKYKTIKNHYLSILKEMPNVLLTPHMAFYTKQAVSDMVENSLLSIVTSKKGKENKFRIC